MHWAHIESCPWAHIFIPHGERSAWSGTTLASGCLDVTEKYLPQTLYRTSEQWCKGWGMRKASRERNATHVFLPEHHQYVTHVSLKRRAQGVGDSLEVHAGCTLAMVSSQFLVWFLGLTQRCFRILSGQQNQPPSHWCSGFSLNQLGCPLCPEQPWRQSELHIARRVLSGAPQCESGLQETS